MNRLSKEKSAYLQHASHQKIDWHPWSEEAFQRAKDEGKPVFLSSGAVWCHWCHVMAKECFYEDDIVNFLNEKFICIKLDRDERPDIDKRYQMATSAMGYGGGWPLSVFMTHEKKPFFGGTYFPPEDKWGKPGFRKVLQAVSDFYNKEQDKIASFTDNLLNSLKYGGAVSTEIREDMIDDAIRAMSGQFDNKNGGFGAAPKFPMPGAMEFFLSRYYFTGDKPLGDFFKNTLYRMAKGGFHDHLGGGFHRYSVDESWIIPHFEKMADDNAWLLRNYVHAYAVFGDVFFKETAEGIIRFFKDVLSAKDGGFYASQDADVTPDDEGGYFTWTKDDFIETLSGEEYRVLKYFLSEQGAMHHDNSKMVIFESKDNVEIAERTGTDVQKVQELIQTGKKKLLAERSERQSPFIDKTHYTSLNGMVITSFIHAFRILGDSYVKDFAFKSLDKIMSQRFINEELFHSDGVKAMLEDYVYLSEANISAYEITADSVYLKAAEKLMDMCIDTLWDDEGGFFDTDTELLGMKIKAIEDTPHPSPNSVAIGLLFKLSFLTGKQSYAEKAEKSLSVFYSRAQNIGVHAGNYFNAMDAYFNPLKLTLSVKPDSGLACEAISSYHPHMTIFYGEDKRYIIPCFKTVCYEPIHNTVDFRGFLSNLRK